jgi:acetoin utilization protein AcuB
MRVWEVMTAGAQTVPPTMPAADAAELMRRNKIHHLVVKRGSDVVGIVSNRDLGGRLRAAIRAGDTVADLMTSDVATVERTDTVRQAAKRMQGRVIGCLPVLDGGRLVGIVTISDLLELLGRGIDRPAAPERPSATHRVAHRKQRGRGKPGTW